LEVGVPSGYCPCNGKPHELKLFASGESASYDKQTVGRIQDIQKMDAETQHVLFNVIDTYIQNFKTKQAFAK
jgi:hypothetical protein